MTPRQIMDGCTAAAHIAYALSDIATVYPITPVASMGETARKWAVDGRKNLMGQAMQVVEMESELGAAGATHGALSGGALATTFTSSQGLLLMIPNMFKISGELLPGVFHVGTRAIAAHALSIFGDHQDVMACRSTGFAFLASASVQETMDLALVAHLSAIVGSIPVCHFFDGWRTSNELASVDVIDYQDIIRLVDWDKVRAFRARAMNPEHPDVRGTAQNSDVYFQNREASNRFYDVFPSIVAEQMRKVGDLTGRRYGLVDYEGAPDADMVIVAMGSACEVACETVAWLNDRGYRTGVVKVRLFRPFPADALLRAIPQTVRAVAVLDRTKEPGANGEPLYQDVATAMFEARRDVVVTGGRYGLGSKDFNPSMVKAVFDELRSMSPRRRFTVGITDDVTGLSLPVADRIDTSGCDMLQCQFYGMGSDGTVGATRQAAQVISECSDRHVQAYFSYSAKKSGGYTVSQLRVSPEPVRSEYMIETADYIGCNKDTYVRRFHVLDNIRSGGIFVLNSSWSADDMERKLPVRLKRRIASAGVKFYNVDAVGIASKVGLGVRINVIMETVFLKLTGIVPFDEAVTRLKALVSSAYMHEGGDVVRKNIAAIDMAADAIVPIDYPASWAGIDDNDQSEHPAPPFVSEVARRCMSLEGNTLPVSAFTPDGFVPSGTTAWEKRRIAVKVPRWNVDNCVECTECSLVCAHAAIRPVVMDDAEASEAPASFVSKPADGDPKLHGFRFRIQVYAEDCTGCGSCSAVCPGHALDMEPLASQLDEQIANLDFAVSSVTLKEELLPRYTVKGSQLRQPLLEFSGACAGCGETPYVKLLTQLFGERMVIANATGCSSIWGAN
ncbi:MAG: pyruvate:ferredoxin (flavodoxin) oxidoreductase, partial [Muribaculaceae bacterium]|nr:pyruvate:ferredoxin (flavodoxin) oxidoreductase [Muribaculaceae bacterium]